MNIDRLNNTAVKVNYLVFLSLNTTVLQSGGLENLHQKKPLKPNFKLEPNGPGFNVWFYCNDGRFYYLLLEKDIFI